jgi:hypothetical protein
MNLEQKTLGELSKEDLANVIRSLTPDEDMHQGIKFLTKLLEQTDEKTLIAFVERMAVILAKEGRFYEYDFTPDEQKILKSCLPDLLNRRQALTNIGYGLGGIALTALGVVNIADNFDPAIRDERAIEAKKQGAFKTGLKRWAVPVFAETALGVAIMNEVVKDWRIMKLEHVANAVAELAKKQETKISR